MWRIFIKRAIVNLAVGTLLLCGLSVNAAQTPTFLPGATIVGAEAVKQMLESGVPVIDVRVANEYVEECIQGARNVPYKEKSAKVQNFDPSVDRFDIARLPADKTAPLIFYCNAGECWKSFKASTLAVKAGYRQVYWFRGGLPEWKARRYPVE